MLHRTLSLTGPTDSNLAFASEHGAVVSGGVILEPSWLGLATDAAILAALPYMSRTCSYFSFDLLVLFGSTTRWCIPQILY